MKRMMAMVLCWALMHPVWGNDISALVKQVDAHVMCIESLSSENGKLNKLTGTGVQIQPGLVVTVAHQVQGVDQIKVYRRDEQVSAAEVLALDPAHDLALLKIAEHPGGVLAPAQGAAQLVIGEEIFSIGCPFGFEHSLSRGYVKKLRVKLDGREFIQMDMSIHTGDSGAPVFDSSGQWIGVVGGYWKKSQSIGFAMPVEQVLDLLAQAGYQRVQKQAPVMSIEALWAVAEAKQGRAQRTLYDNIIQLVARNDREVKLRGLAYLGLGQVEQAIVLLRGYVKQVPQDVLTHVLLAEMLVSLQRHQAALEYLLIAKQLKPEYATTYLYLGQVYDLGYADMAAAITSYQQFLTLSPNSAESFRVKRWLARHKGS